MRFAPAAGVWVVSRWRDVDAALRDPAFAMPGDPAGRSSASLREAGIGEWVRARQRDPFDDRAPVFLADFARVLRQRGRADLVRDFARPWGRDLACRVGDVPESARAAVLGLGEAVFGAAAEAEGPVPSPETAAATLELSRRLPVRGRLDTQGFVALAFSLPALVAGIAHELLGDPPTLLHLRQRPEALRAGLDELLRLAAPTRAVFRVARVDAAFEGVVVPAGSTLALNLAAANRDPERFPEPHRIDFGRTSGGHLAFGGGPRRCPGAALVRRATEAGLRALLTEPVAPSPTEAVRWGGGFAIRFPESLPVVRECGGPGKDRDVPG